MRDSGDEDEEDDFEDENYEDDSDELCDCPDCTARRMFGGFW